MPRIPAKEFSEYQKSNLRVSKSAQACTDSFLGLTYSEVAQVIAQLLTQLSKWMAKEEGEEQ